MKPHFIVALLLAWAIALAPAVAFAQAAPNSQAQLVPDQEGKVRIDFDDVSITAIIDAISKLAGKNFIYDDRVRGKVTIISPEPVTVEEAWAVFESVLKVKGFTAVPGPADVLKIIPVRDAKESNIETVRDNRESADRDQFVTRLIPLYYIDADAITNTIKPLVSKDASMVVYTPTNTIILTDTKSNIRRLMGILDALDVETHKEELAVIKILYADAATLGKQITDIYGGKSSGGKSTAASARAARSTRRTAANKAASQSASLNSVKRGEVRIITESRTNSLIVMASRSQIADIRGLVRKLDVPVVGGGKIHVYYLKHADAEEMSKTLTGLISGSGRGGGASAGSGRTGKVGSTQALRSVVTPLAEGKINLSADPSTNSLVIQASKEAYETLRQVIEMLDIPRPQVLVEAIIMEVDITDDVNLGVRFFYSMTNDTYNMALRGASAASTGGTSEAVRSAGNTFFGIAGNNEKWGVLLDAAAKDDRFNILSSPHILTSDNEEAEIRIGDNIPIITSRVASATGNVAGLSSAVDVERKDVGVTLRVTPQISEGDTLRLKIFQEITAFNQSLTDDVTSSSDAQVGVALTNRRVENTVVVSDGDTVVIGGLIAEIDEINIDKIPFLGDIPWIGWLFKSTEKSLRKTNLMVMLTPHIVRNPDDLERETIRKRREFAREANERDEIARIQQEIEQGNDDVHGRNLLQNTLLDHYQRYPIERMSEIEAQREEDRRELIATREAAIHGPRYLVNADVRDEARASQTLTEIIDLGYDARLVSRRIDGSLVFELEVGPFGTEREAGSTSVILRRAMNLDPWVVEIPAEQHDGLEAPTSETLYQ